MNIELIQWLAIITLFIVCMLLGEGIATLSDKIREIMGGKK